MAVDTVEKRASAPNHWLGTILPLPDGTISAADRIQVGGEYSGIADRIQVGGEGIGTTIDPALRKEIIFLTSKITRIVSKTSAIAKSIKLTSEIDI